MTRQQLDDPKPNSKTARRQSERDLCQANAPALYHYGFWLSGNRTTAEELVHTTCANTRVTSVIPSDYATQRRNLFRSLHQNYVALGAPINQTSSVVDDDVVQIEPQARLRHLLLGLPASTRAPLILQVLEDFDVPDISAITGDSPNHVRQRLRKARCAILPQLQTTDDADYQLACCA